MEELQNATCTSCGAPNAAVAAMADGILTGIEHNTALQHGVGSYTNSVLTGRDAGTDRGFSR